MNSTELEYAISQYVDGTLPPAERAALEEALAGDPVARATLAEYEALQAALKTALPAPADIDYDALGARISAAVAQEKETPVRHYAMPWVGQSRRALAVAASVLLAIGVGIVSFSVLRNQPNIEVTIPTPSGGNGGAAMPTVVVVGPQAEAAAVPAVEQISVGPSDQLASNWTSGQAVVSRPPRVLIYSALDPAQDTRLLSY